MLVSHIELMAMANILLVDDERSIVFATSDYLRARGHHVDVANELDAAKHLLLYRRYALVIADLRLSGSSSMEGLELLDFVHAQAKGTAFVLLTAYGSSKIVASATARGARVVHKPTPLADLAKLTSELVAAGS
jgi:DNA-binding NtrC family response regulator